MTGRGTLNLRIDEELLAAAKRKAKAEDLTMSQVVRRLLRAWLSGDPPEPKPKPDSEE